MAKKGQKFNSYTDKQRQEIVDKYINNEGSYTSIAFEYGISKKTVESMVRKYRKTGITKRLKPPGRLKESEIDYKERYEILKKYRAFLKVQREKK
jgi:transposase